MFDDPNRLAQIAEALLSLAKLGALVWRGIRKLIRLAKWRRQHNQDTSLDKNRPMMP